MTAPGDSVPRSAPLSAARLCAVQALYQMDITDIDTEHVIAEFLDHRLVADPREPAPGETAFHPADRGFFRQLVIGVVAAQTSIDPLLNACLAEGWRLARIDSILRAILRAAAFEILERADTPAKVVISEYVDVAHAFFEGDEAKVVNGILDRLARAVREGELGEAGGD